MFAPSANTRARLRRGIAIVIAALVFTPTQTALAASSWGPTLLVNTESFQTIDAGTGTSDIELRFGSASESLKWDYTNQRFTISDDVQVDSLASSGTLTVDGEVKTKSNLTINSDSGAADAVLTFGSDTTNESITFLNTADRFEFSDDVATTGALAASGALSVAGTADVDGAATFGSTVDTVGDITTDANLTINEDSGAVDAVLTFGSDGTNETITFLNTEDRFEVSDDFAVTGTLAASGALSVDGAAVFDSTVNVSGAATFGSTVSLGGVTYTFPGVDGQTGYVLESNGSGVLSWVENTALEQSDADARYVQVSGDTMTGGLAIHSADGLASSGSIITEGNFTLNSDNADQDAVLTFGNDTAAQTITYTNATEQFDISDNIAVTGTIEGTDNLTINSDQGAVDAVLTFGSDGTNETLTWANTADRFEFSDEVYTDQNYLADGDLTLNLDDTAADVVITFGDADADETLLWGYQADRFEFSDDVHATGGITASGAVVIEGTTTAKGLIKAQGGLSGASLQVDGAGTINGALEVNADNLGDAVITFGNATLDETITYSDGSARFEISDDIYTADTITVDGAATFGSTVSLGGVTYTFPGADGQVGYVLESNGSGVLSWVENTALEQSDADARYVQVAGDTMTGGLAIHSSEGLASSGAIITEAGITINSDNAAQDAVFTFGSDGTAETLTFLNDEDRFEFSDDIATTGALAASGALSVAGTADIDGAVTMGSTLDTVGNITTDGTLKVNDDDTGTATISFGNDAGTESLVFSDTNNNFSFSDDVHAEGNITGSGTMTIAGVSTFEGLVKAQAGLSGSSLTVDSGTVSINGVDYEFTNSDGSAGTFLQTDGAGNLTWAANAVSNSSGGILFISPEYPHASYYTVDTETSDHIGTLAVDYDSTNFENYNRWSTSQSSTQDYNTAIRVRVPDNFANWDTNSAPIQFRYRTSAASAVTDDIDVTIIDTAGVTESGLSGHSDLTSNNAWATADITGLAGTYTAGQFMTVILNMQTSTNSGYADAGWMEFNWNVTTP